MENKFYEILENILEVKVNENSNLSMQNCKNWTSLNHIDIIMSLEEEFEIKFSKDELSQLKSQNELLQAIKEKLC
ncbi:acyl carrier protein [Campylobacter subantarcticus LMG 24377]|uniref:Acyl carrier protein n=2 Tax=Campylobacter subantarcticus TaxID=497724 RepID=A0A0A8HBF2_9BACT|nr:MULTISPECIES: acyl carrier protein [Campylobacter]MCR8683426.1 acyl carrier protein [Campylobacter sp. LMG 17559]MCR8698177.1 acyl carrier protein [Campylobacter sp. LMG 7929]MCR8707107.1 acyl carrier protein [Campylobacter sp. W0066.2]AJC91312.1 acyl carrier protein [Campylobacter subantarcticus LMG 24374]AJC93079.1 acyl carrier protein [Campylobacter subantarcticus LMG 24377]